MNQNAATLHVWVQHSIPPHITECGKQKDFLIVMQVNLS